MSHWTGRGSRHERGYGALWDRIRKQAMTRDKHLCVPCMAHGRCTPAREVDHITPKEQGGTDDLSNLQSICRACHSDKTAREGHAARKRQRDGQGFGIPEGMKPSAIPVIVIAGPPASGKTTHAHSIKREGDTILDLDDTIEAMTGKRWSSDFEVVRRALDERDRVLTSLHTQRKGRCILIVTAPSPAERTAWVTALGMRARLIVMQTSAAECIRRITADPARAHAAARHIAAVKEWR